MFDRLQVELRRLANVLETVKLGEYEQSDLPSTGFLSSKVTADDIEQLKEQVRISFTNALTRVRSLYLSE